MTSDSQRTYTEGYDEGYQDAWSARSQKHRRPRNANASAFRFGYADGFEDGRTMGQRNPRAFASPTTPAATEEPDANGI